MMIRSASSRSHSIAIIILTVLTLSLFLVHAGRRAFICDDAYISFRYARNLAHGQGMVFNPGERVEGYTNFLWVMLMVPVELAGGDPAPVSILLGIIFAFGSLAASWKLTRRLFPDSSWAPPASLLMLALHPSFAAWSSGGLETSLFTCLLTWGLYLTITEPGGRAAGLAGVTLAAAAMTRPEGILFAGLTFLFFLHLKRSRSLIRFSAAFLLPFAPYTVWRLAWFGNLLPNTFYAKVGGIQYFSSGLQYIAEYIHSYHLELALPLLAAGFLATERKGLRTPRRFALTSLLFYLFYVAWVGGDFMAYRFLVPVIPLLFVMLIGGLSLFAGWLTANGTRLMVPAIGLQIIMLAAIAHGVSECRLINIDRGIDTTEMMADYIPQWRLVGNWLKRYAEPDEWLATRAVGIIPYLSDLPTIDLLGLTDPVVAHAEVGERGRIAHEKKVPVGYLEQRNVTYLFEHPHVLKQPRYLPYSITVYLGEHRFFDFTSTQPLEQLRQRLLQRNAPVLAQPIPVARTVASSTEMIGFEPEHATDNDWSSAWHSFYSDREWLEMSFAEPYPINRLAIFWDHADSQRRYTVQISADGGQWQPVASEVIRTGNLDRCLFTESTAQAVRIEGQQRGNRRTYGLLECHAWREPQDPRQAR